MGFWEKSLWIFKSLREAGTQSVRQLAQQTGLSKSSAHRLQQALERRNCYPESWLWETEAGRRWLTRLVVATLYSFGLKSGVGVETISEFFARLQLATSLYTGALTTPICRLRQDSKTSSNIPTRQS